VIGWPSCLVDDTGKGIETTNGENMLKLVELFAIDGFGCKFVAVCVGLKSGDDRNLRSYGRIRAIVGPDGLRVIRTRRVISK
jgi:hypothetical protein